MKYLTPQNIFGFISLVGMITFWIYTQNSLPKKVENHESRLIELEQNKIELQTKMDMTLNSVMEIRALLHQFLLKEKEK